MATMERDVADLAKYATVIQTAAACGVNERRVRNWQNLGLLVPATRVGLIQFRMVDVLRCAVLLELQRYLGQDSPLATELALALTPQQLESIPTTVVQPSYEENAQLRCQVSFIYLNVKAKPDIDSAFILFDMPAGTPMKLSTYGLRRIKC
jgi:DNA-binding transcriptional MerR regulator